jgi:quercetin dioxygenase-like cupin family protein
VPNEPCPSELDALTAAPENHKLLFENDTVRMLDTVIQPGRTTPLHSHRWPAALYVLSGGDFLRRDQNGAVTFDSRNAAPLRAGAVICIPPLPPHSLENIGTTEIRIIAVELKNER